MLSKQFQEPIVSIILTGIVISLLLASGPAAASNMSANGLGGAHNGAYKQGKDVNIKVDVELGNVSGKMLKIKYANVKLTGPEWSGTKICKVYKNKKVEGCDFLSVNKIDVRKSDCDNHDNHESCYGYGYGDKDCKKNSRVSYMFVIDSSDLNPGNYSLSVDVYTGTDGLNVFSSDVKKFEISPKKPKEKGDGCDKDHEEDDHQNDKINHDNEDEVDNHQDNEDEVDNHQNKGNVNHDNEDEGDNYHDNENEDDSDD